jgi:hypothetical protein
MTLAQRTLSEMDSSFKPRRIMNVSPVDENLDIVLGTTKGNQFSSATAAQKLADTLKLPKQQYEIKEIDGGFVVKLSSAVDQFGQADALVELRGISTIRSILDTADSTLIPKLVQEAHLAEAASGRVTQGIQKVLNGTWGKLSPGQKTSMDRVLSAQRSDERWWDTGEFIQNYRDFTGKAPTQKEILAFGTQRQLNDF